MARRNKIDRSVGMVTSEVVETEGAQTIFGASGTKSQIAQLGVRLSKDSSGNERLTIVFSENQSAGDEFDFSSFLHRRDIAIGFAEAFYGWGAAQDGKSKKGIQGDLRSFFVFLDEHEEAEPTAAPVIALSQLTTSLLNAFVDWLNNQKIIKSRKNKGKPLSEPTKAGRLGGIRTIIEWLKQHRRAKMASHCEVPFNPWPGRTKRSIPRQVLSKLDHGALERACLKEIEEIWANIERGRALIQKALPHLPPKGEPINLDNLGTCLAYIEQYYDGLTPTRNYLKSNDPKLHKAIEYKHKGRTRINQYLRPTIRMLIPFIIFIASRTFGNIDSILLMERDCLSDHPVLSHRKIVIWRKGRAIRNQKRSYDVRVRKPESVLVLIERVLFMTEPLVSKVQDDEHRNLLFLYHALYRGEKSVNSFYRKNYSSSSDDSFRKALADFQLKHGLPRFNPSSLRLTGSDRVDEVTKGDIKARQIVLNHEQVQTTQNHYNTDAIRQRNSERIATIQGKFVGWIRSNGNLDPRVVAKTLKELKPREVEAIANGQNATTTGFICKNPLDSPQPGESKGKLCSAWLGCFICENAIIILDAETLARLLQLEAHLLRARTTLNSMRFALLYEAKLKILQSELLSRFTDPVIRMEAEKLLLTLSPLPDVE